MELLEKTEHAELLQKCPNNRIASFIHNILDSICGHAAPKYEDYSSLWDLQSWWRVTDFYESFTKKIIKYKCSRDEASKCLGSLAGNLKQPVLDAIWARWDELREALVRQTDAISHAQLTDFDWNMKLSMSSDKISTVHEPLLHVDMSIAAGEKNKTVSVELNKGELKKMITSLEAANKVMTQLKS